MQRSASQSGPAAARSSAVGLGLQREASPFLEPVGPAGDAFEREADRIADAVLRGGPHRPANGWAVASGADDTIQRKCEECEENEDEQIRRAPRDSADVAAPPGPPPSSKKIVRIDADAAPIPESGEAETPRAQARPSLIAEDDSEAGGGQMRKSEFLSALRAEVSSAVDEALSGTGRDSNGCPWIDHWFGYYEGRSATEIERSLHRYAPEARTAAIATEYIPVVTARIRRSAKIFAKSGEIAGVPPDAPTGPGAGGAVLDAFGGMFFKARPGGARRTDPISIRRELGAGQALPGAVRARMETAFGARFSGVRIHVDANAARLSDRLNARAFTIGEHVGFGGGEFRPGTIVGDALIAHELAHVVQQHDARREATGAPSHHARLERDADTSAAAAVLRSSGRFGASVAPRLRSGLTLQRCSKPSPAINIKAMSPDQLDTFINAYFDRSDRREARAILDDILDSQDDLRFADLEELSTEIHKRLSTSRLMRRTQELYGRAFEYPNHSAAKRCVGGRNNPRVNKAAEKYWGPVQNPEGLYHWDLSEEGKKDPYQALVTLFTPQRSICDMTLIHCDYLVSVVHFRAFAERLGAAEFNRRVAAGEIKMELRWNGFAGIEEDGAPGASGVSLREMRPHSERDLVIGDHVIFWNHRAYDAINEKIRNAWRLENAVLIEKRTGDDLFLGHGSGRKTNTQMRAKLAEEFNEVVRKAMRLIRAIARGGSRSTAARTEMSTDFPNVREESVGKWEIKTRRSGDFDVKEIRGSDPDLTGLRDPDDPSKMYPVKRPVESE